MKQIRLWSTAPGAAKATPTAVAAFAYGISGRLYAAWDPRISPALKTGYRYDQAQRITSVIPPGEQPYTFTYGQAAGTSTSGRHAAPGSPDPPSNPARRQKPTALPPPPWSTTCR